MPFYYSVVSCFPELSLNLSGESSNFLQLPDRYLLIILCSSQNFGEGHICLWVRPEVAESRN